MGASKSTSPSLMSSAMAKKRVRHYAVDVTHSLELGGRHAGAKYVEEASCAWVT